MNIEALKKATCDVESALEGNEKALAAFKDIKWMVEEYLAILESSAREKSEVLMDCISFDGDEEEILDELRDLLASGDSKAFAKKVDELEERYYDEIVGSERMNELNNSIGNQLFLEGDIAEYLASTMSPSQEPCI